MSNQIKFKARPHSYRSVMQHTCDAFYEATMVEVERLNRRETAARKHENWKRMNPKEAQKHYRLVRQLLAQRLRDRGWTLDEIGMELGGLTRQRIEQILKDDVMIE